MARTHYKDIVRNGVVVPIGEFQLPEGTLVDIVVSEDAEWSMLSHQSFAEDWESEEDSIYDEWREHYGVSKESSAGRQIGRSGIGSNLRR
ncbi:MAG: hypothetical protein ACK4I8_05715 [Armatimonadota bacterium]